MENREQENKAKSSSTDPKPTDEVQLFGRLRCGRKDESRPKPHVS